MPLVTSGAVVSTPTVPAGTGALPDIANVQSSNDPHLLLGGSYEGTGLCGPGVISVGIDPCARADMQQAVGAIGYTAAYAGIVLTGASCLGPVDLASLQEAALRNSDTKINRTIQDNIVGGLIPLNKFTTSTSTGNGLAEAESGARCTYFGQAVLHINPKTATQWMGREIIRVGRHLETVAGSLVSLSCGVADKKIAVTGYLTIYKGANRVLPPLSAAPSAGAPGATHSNHWFVSVQTPVTLFNDCDLALLITGA